mmetsp:Transcript_7585/g.11583  ORF Transcript_7585/g.11583 Transcript_7585/m.11583 type:complete len:369 (-) Transcript_7585:75-1181(-)
MQTPPLPVTETILGIDECALVGLSSEDRNKRFVHTAPECFVNETTGLGVSYGSFDTPTVESLRKLVDALPPHRRSEKTSSCCLTTRSNVDIGALQGTLTTKDCAMVQVASNFNCLENGGRHTSLNSGFFVDGACRDWTQGPAAVFGTLPAYLWRCHFYKGGQSIPGMDPVNLLRHTSQYFGIPHKGKLTLKGNEVPIRTEADIDKAAGEVCIGLHSDCPVMFGRTKTAVTYNEPKIVAKEGDFGYKRQEFPMVDQALSASINLNDEIAFRAGYGPVGGSEESIYNITRSLLRAAYQGIYLAAILRQRKVLYLTLVGGGSFGNPIPLIVDEIRRAHNQWANHPASQLQECIICLYSPDEEEIVREELKD